MTMYHCNVLYSIPVQVVITVYWRQYIVAFTDVFLLYIISYNREWLPIRRRQNTVQYVIIVYGCQYCKYVITENDIIISVAACGGFISLSMLW